jgi:DNA-binding response OmpR family regulator
MLGCKILVMGCDRRVGAMLAAALGQRRFTVLAQGFDDVEATLRDFEPDLVVARPSDEPPLRGLRRVCEHTRAPILLLLPAGTAHEVLIEALKNGADDVMIEPVELDEVVTRVEAMLRRLVSKSSLVAGDVTIDLDAHTAWRADHRLDLTDIEFDVLADLVRNVGVVVSKRELLNEVWGFEDYPVNLAEVHVCALRRKLEVYGERIIETVRSHGYIIREAPHPRLSPGPLPH